MQTILLDPDTWDLTLDVSGNMALAPQFIDNRPIGDAYAQAQDAASEVKLFAGELYYDTGRGVPYWQEILGHLPSVPLMTARFVEAALQVQGVVAARCFISSLQGREVRGQVQITNDQGVAQRLGF